MEWLIWSGAVVSLAGVAGLVWCILYVLRARSAGLSESALKARLQKGVAMNMGALFVSAIGLMMVVVGLFLS